MLPITTRSRGQIHTTGNAGRRANRRRKLSAILALLVLASQVLAGCSRPTDTLPRTQPSSSTTKSVSGTTASTPGHSATSSRTTDKSQPTVTSTSSQQTGTTAPPAPPATPTPRPSPTPVPVPVAASSLPGYVAPVRNGSTWSKTSPTLGLMRWEILNAAGNLQQTAPAAQPIAFGSGNAYTDVEGVLTFRGNNQRNSPTYGSAAITQNKLRIVWTHEIGAVSGNNSYWAGAGWTGQPLLVRWPEATRRAMGLKPEAKNKAGLVEVIYPVFDGNIYFLDLETGQRTRDPIDATFGFKGTASVDPRGWPLLYAGQGLNDRNGTKGPFQYRVFDLIQNKQVWGIPGSDSATYRSTSWGAFDSSGLIDRRTDTLIQLGENGFIYRVKLNSTFDAAAAKVTLAPELIKTRYRTARTIRVGIESSPAAWRNFIYFSDNDGNLLCVDINTMEIVWGLNVQDDSDATMVLEETAEGVFLYHGNTLDHRGRAGVAEKDRVCSLRKINALSGQVIWTHNVPVIYQSDLNSGLLASPLLGTGDWAGTILFNVCKTTSSSTGLLLALNKDTGEPVWERKLDRYSWSSPIAIRGTDGRSRGIYCDFAGIMHLFDLKTGADLDQISIGANCEASPSAFDNRIVVATYDCKIFCVEVG